MSASEDIGADFTAAAEPDQHSGPDNAADHRAAAGHHDAVAQPHTGHEGPVADAEVVAARSAPIPTRRAVPGARWTVDPRSW